MGVELINICITEEDSTVCKLQVEDPIRQEFQQRAPRDFQHFQPQSQNSKKISKKVGKENKREMNIFGICHFSSSFEQHPLLHF